MKRIFLIWVTVGLAFLNATGQDSVYLFSYFLDNGQDGLHLAYSADGLVWTALNNNETFLSPTAGTDKLMRDPCIVQGGDGKFHMVWTVSWNEQGIGYATSDDLIHWSEQLYLPVMRHEPQARNCWAPEVFYDKGQNLYMIYWSSTIPGRFSQTDSTGDNGYNHRMYYVTTPDFQEFSETSVLYDQGFNVIDGTIQKINNQYYLFLKNETKYPKVEKNIRIATSPTLTGPYTTASAPITDDWVEGPTVTRIGDDWVVFFDRYTRHQMGAVSSSDLLNWNDISNQISFPEGTRHGSVFKVSRKQFQSLITFKN